MSERPSGSPWVIEALGLLLGAILVVALWTVTIEAPYACRTDLVPTYVAAKLWAAGHLDAVYSEALFVDLDTAHPEVIRLYDELLGVAPDPVSYVYSPLYLLLWMPVVQALSLPLFMTFVVMLNALATVFVGSSCARWAGVASGVGRLGVGMGLGLFAVVADAAWLGQNSLQLVALLVAAMRAAEADRGTWVVVFSVLAALMKPWAVLAVGLWAVARRWRWAAATAGGAVFALVVLPWLVVPTSLRVAYAGVMGKLSVVSILAGNNVSVRALLHRLGDPTWGAYVRRWVALETPAGQWVGEVALVGGIGLGCAAWAWSRKTPLRPTVAAFLALMPLPLGVLWTHYLSMSLPAVAVALAAKPRWLRALGVVQGAWLALQPLSPFTSWVYGWGILPTSEQVALAPAAWAWAHGISPVLLTMLAVGVLVDAGRRPTSEGAPTGHTED